MPLCKNLFWCMPGNTKERFMASQAEAHLLHVLHSILYPYFIHFVSIFHPFCIHISSILYPYFIHFVSIFHPFVSIFHPFGIHISSILYPHFIHFVSTFHPFCIHISSILYPYFIHFCIHISSNQLLRKFRIGKTIKYYCGPQYMVRPVGS
jgi:hypothetical protein